MKKVYKAHILFTKEKDRFEIFENGYIAVENGIVVGVANSLDELKVQCPKFNVQDAEVIDFGDKLLIPAMNDMHLQNYTFPEESKYADTAYA